MRLILALVALVHLIASCVPPTPSAPPAAQMPTAYPGVTTSSGSIATLPWRKLYDDPVLQTLIEQALARNFDVELAYAAILQSEASLGIIGADQSIFVNGILQAPYYVTSGNKPPGTPENEFAPQAGIDAYYQIDLFGKLASATGAARNRLLSTEAAKDTVLATVVAEVASAYFQLRELDEVLAFTQKAADVREEGLRLMKLRVEGGESSMQDQRQSEQALYEVTENLPKLRQSIAQTENALSVLTGDYPHEIRRGLPLQDQIQLPSVPYTGVPSDLLQRRPDIQEAQSTIAASAGDVDVARKLLYPTLTLGATAAIGWQKDNAQYPNLPPSLSEIAAMNGVFYGPLGLFSILPQLLQPIFNGGKIKSQIHLAQAQQQQVAIAYLQTVHRAFQEVSDNIAAYNESLARTEQLKLYQDASLDSVRLANERYENGYTSYLEVLNAQTRSYQAQTDYAQGQLNERLALVQLYLSLGGGWQTQ